MPLLHRFTAVAAVVGAFSVAGCGLLPKTPFEGELRVRLTADNITGDALVAMKGPAVRLSLADMPAAWMLVRFDQRAVSAIDDTSKTAMELTADDVEKAFAKAGWGDLLDKQAAKNEPQPQIEKTGDDDTVAGRDCDIWRIRFPDGDTGTVCVADLGKMPWSGVVEQAPVAALLGTDHFPLRAVVTDAAGRTVSSIEVVGIDERGLDEARFMIPAGYTTVSLGGLVREVSAALGAFADRVTAPPRSAQPLNAPVPPTPTTPTTTTATETDYGAMFDSIAKEVGTIVTDLQKGQATTTTTTQPSTANSTTTTTQPTTATTKSASGPVPNAVAARALADLRCQLQESGQGAFGILCLNPPKALTCVDVLGAAHGITWSTKPTVRLLYANADGSSTGFPDVGGGMTGNPCSGVYDPQTRARTGELPSTPTR